MPTAQQPPTLGLSGPTSTVYKYKDDERKWQPIFHSSRFISAGFHREELIVEPPASFDGSEGTYQAGFDNDNMVFVLKVAPNPILTDPHDINSYYKEEYGLVTADDSARNQAFKAAAKNNMGMAGLPFAINLLGRGNLLKTLADGGWTTLRSVQMDEPVWFSL